MRGFIKDIEIIHQRWLNGKDFPQFFETTLFRSLTSLSSEEKREHIGVINKFNEMSETHKVIVDEVEFLKEVDEILTLLKKKPEEIFKKSDKEVGKFIKDTENMYQTLLFMKKADSELVNEFRDETHKFHGNFIFSAIEKHCAPKTKESLDIQLKYSYDEKERLRWKELYRKYGEDK